MGFQDLKTVRQVAEANAAFSENGIRWLIFNRDRNGFSDVVVKLGGRVLLDISKLNEWIEKNRASNRSDARPRTGSEQDQIAASR